MQLNFKTGPACVQMAMPHIDFLYPTWPLMDRLREGRAECESDLRSNSYTTESHWGHNADYSH